MAPDARSGLLVDAGDRVGWAAAIAVLVATAGFAVWLAAGGPGTGTDQAASNLGELGAAVVAGGACIRAARRASFGRARRVWWLIGVGCLAWAAGQLVWTVEQTVLRWDEPFPSLGDIGFAVASVAWLAGLLAAADRRGRQGVPVRMFLDGLIVGGGVFLVSWMLLLEPLAAQAPTGWLASGLTFFYPLVDIAIVAVLVLLMAEGSVLSRRSMVVLGSGFALLAVADSVFVYTQLNGDTAGQLSDVTWFGGLLVVALAGLEASRHPDRATHRGADVGLFSLLVPYVPVVVAMGLAAVRGAGGPDSPGPVELWVTLALFTVILIRQVLVLRDNQAVNRSLRRALDDASHAALHDPLTGLPNRALAMAVLDRDVERARRSGQWFALVFLDLDDFKGVNDTLGHSAGDDALREVGARLTRAARGADLVARFGGDEFVVLLDAVDSEEDAERVATRVVDALELPLRIDGRVVSVRASMGVAVGDGDQKADDLLAAADDRMYRQKSERKR